MTNIVWMGLPVSFHLGKEIDLVETLHLGNCSVDGTLLLRVKVWMVGPVVSIQPGSDRLQCFIFCVIWFRKHFHRLPLEIRQGHIETIRGESSVEREIRWIENVRWSIVTVNTVHPPSRHARDLRWC